MMRVLILFVWMLLPTITVAAEWVFSPKIALTGSATTGVFHHLEGAGRKHIAVSAEQVAVVWEDNSSGDPQVYLTHQAASDRRFQSAIRVSDGQEAYEPAIAALEAARFVVVYEQDGVVYARLFSPQGLGEAIQLSAEGAAAGQASVAAYGGRAMAVWREKRQRRYGLKVVSLTDTADGLKLGKRYQVEPEVLATPVLKPSITMNDSSVCIAWEDRRAGHTRLLVTTSDLVDVSFSTPAFLNEFYSKRNEYDKGNGVTRVSIAGFAEDEVLASWMDKRTGGKGYGIYAALGSEGGVDFGPNEKVHGAQGDELPHYNPAVAGNRAGSFAVVWDDFRQGDSDIWLSHYNDDSEWSADYAPAIASGPGEQTHASIALDEKDVLYMVWIERQDSNSPTQLWFSFARLR
jgi:hypothetical protein